MQTSNRQFNFLHY